MRGLEKERLSCCRHCVSIPDGERNRNLDNWSGTNSTLLLGFFSHSHKSSLEPEYYPDTLKSSLIAHLSYSHTQSVHKSHFRKSLLKYSSLPGHFTDSPPIDKTHLPSSAQEEADPWNPQSSFPAVSPNSCRPVSHLHRDRLRAPHNTDPVSQVTMPCL